jgi:excisionase family DNA binding protein
MEELLKVREVMVRLRMSRSTVYRMIERGDLDVVRIGRNIRVRKESVDRFFGDGEVDGKIALYRC